MEPTRQAATSCRMSSNRGLPRTSSSRMPCTADVSSGIGISGSMSQLLRSKTAPFLPKTMPISTMRSFSGSRPVVSVSMNAIVDSVQGASASSSSATPMAATRMRCAMPG